ncbi:MAG: MMPL family transporter [Longimicrobiales bacterium]|nr:MMPL family transporter [Longimicrobiales bacterium]
MRRLLRPASRPGGSVMAGRRRALLARISGWLHTLSIRRPRLVIGVAVVLSLAGAWIYFNELDIVSSRGALADPSEVFIQRWAAYQSAFGGDHKPLVLVMKAVGDSAEEASEGTLVEPSEAQREAMKRVADRWAAELEARPDLFPRVTLRVPLSEFGDHALLYLPLDAVEEVSKSAEAYLPTVETVAADPRASTLVEEIRRRADALDASSGGERSGAGEVAVLEALLGWLRHEVTGEAGPGGTPSAAAFGGLGLRGIDPEGYLFVGEGRILTVLADATADTRARNAWAEVIEVATEALEVARGEIPDSVRIDLGFTGEPALQHEESVISQRDFGRSTALALLLVSLLFMWAFRTVLRPGLASICLGMSLAMTFGVAWLTIGHLNVLSMVFAVILVALGIDFAIHLFTHYQLGRESGEAPDAAIRHTYASVGGTLWIAGLATALAFLTAYLTDFPGLSELGLIAGLGLIVSLACMYFVFPAMLHLFDRSRGTEEVPRRRTLPGIAALSRPTASFRGGVVIAVTAAAATLGAIFGEYTMDTDLLALQPDGGEAAGWQELLLDVEDRTTFALATYPDRASLERARTALAALPMVGWTESAFPTDEEEKRDRLAGVCRALASVEVRRATEVSVADTRRALFGLRQTLRRYAATGPQAGDALAGAIAHTEATFAALGALGPADADLRLRAVSDTLHDALGRGLTDATGLACPPALDLATLPFPARSRFIGNDGSFALRIHPARDTWTSEDLEWFIEGTRALEPAIFGRLVNVFENARTMARSFVQAALYAAVAILALLLTWSRSVRLTLLSILPLVAGFGLLLGAMRWGPLPVRWNLANLFAVPILIGIGIDGGVHLVRAWALGDRERFNGAMEAVLMSALTTMIGFGLLSTGDHAGVASLGLIVFLGIGLNLVACLGVLPFALARWVPRPSPAASRAPVRDGQEGGEA